MRDGEEIIVSERCIEEKSHNNRRVRGLTD